MPENRDPIILYGKALGWELKSRTILVEGTSDVDLLRMGAKLKLEKDGDDLFEGLAIVAAGEKNRGGTPGVIRELVTLRNMARNLLSPDGGRTYRFIGLFDNDHAGRMAVKQAQQVDTSIVEYKDVFRLRPTMPRAGNLDPKTLEKTFEKRNIPYKGLDWEIEDLLSNDFFVEFEKEHPGAVLNKKEINDKTHRDLTRDGKDAFHKYIRDNAIYEDLKSLLDLLKALRFYLILDT